MADKEISNLQEISWSSLQGEKLEGTLNNENITAETVSDGIFYTLENGQSMNLIDVGKTEVVLPKEEEAQKPDDGKEDTSGKLYQIVNGEKQYDLPLIKQTIQDWFKQTDYYTTDLRMNRVNASLDEIVYFNVNSEKSQNEFGAYVTENNKKRFQTFRFKPELDKVFEDGSVESIDDLKKYFNENRENHPIATEGAPISIEDSVTQQQINTIWNNIKDRLKNVGVQFSSINDAGEKTDRFDNAELITGFITPWTETHASMDMGFGKGTIFTGIVCDRKTGETNRVDVTIKAKTNALEPQENLIAGKDFAIQRVATKEVTLVEDIRKASMANIDYFIEDKRD